MKKWTRIPTRLDDIQSGNHQPRIFSLTARVEISFESKADALGEETLIIAIIEVENSDCSNSLILSFYDAFPDSSGIKTRFHAYKNSATTRNASTSKQSPPRKLLQMYTQKTPERP